MINLSYWPNKMAVDFTPILMSSFLSTIAYWVSKATVQAKLPKYSAEEAIEKYHYFVGRTTSHMLPVYCEVQVIYANEIKGRKEDEEILITKLRKAEGNLFQLRRDIDDFLFARYKREFICQISELQNMLLYSGDFEDELKEFLLNKGFWFAISNRKSVI